MFLQLGIPSFPACQLAPALKPRCDQRIITMVLRLMQIVQLRTFPQDKTLKFCCECAIYHPCTYRVQPSQDTNMHRCTHAVQYEQIVCRLCPNTHILWPQPPPILHTDNISATSCEECNCRTFTQCTFPFCQEQSRTLILVQGRQGGILFRTKLM